MMRVQSSPVLRMCAVRIAVKKLSKLGSIRTQCAAQSACPSGSSAASAT